MPEKGDLAAFGDKMAILISTLSDIWKCICEKILWGIGLRLPLSGSGLARRKAQQGNHGLALFDGESVCRKAKTRLLGGFFK
ncbi:hypothetical protein NL386_02105 [Klebsiella pneumoniae]|uniref:hypothetical protein n=1 Tax=Klebsiella pneumoniae TaxID=573 RepID=UPI000A573DA5|nr:hypothetical protein [Klebsiella pneumoniae]MCP5996536.1 hypothetical protein [Klebsiella pneumoniae]